jgi:hypothetical protein
LFESSQEISRLVDVGFFTNSGLGFVFAARNAPPSIYQPLDHHFVQLFLYFVNFIFFTMNRKISSPYTEAPVYVIRSDDSPTHVLSPGHVSLLNNRKIPNEMSRSMLNQRYFGYKPF